MKEKCTLVPERLNRVGGEAVLDGVMMKAGTACPTAVRMPNGKIRVLPREFHSVKEKHKWMNLPVLRGVVGFIETLKLSMSVLTASAEVAAEEEIKESKCDKWMKEHLGFSLMGMVSFFSALLGIALALAMFIYLPNLASTGIERLFHIELGVWKAVTGGVFKILIFVLYIYLVSFMPDIRRTFRYHGAEHKSIACFESGMDLTPANAKKCTRFHPRCGTSFMFVMILLGIVLSLAVRAVLEIGFSIDFEVMTRNALGVNLEPLIYTGVGLLLLPLVMGLGYEFLMFAGKHPSNPLVRVFSAPGLWMQRLTTKEPTEEQLAVAITSICYALPEFFPDFPREKYASETGYLPGEEQAEPQSADAPVETEVKDVPTDSDAASAQESAPHDPA